MAVVVAAPAAQPSFINNVGTYLGNQSVYDKGLKLASGLLTLAGKVVPFAAVAESFGTLAKTFSDARTTIKVIDFVADATGLDQSYNVQSGKSDVHVANMQIAASTFFLAADIANPLFFAANLGLVAIKSTIMTGLKVASGAFALVGLGITIASSAYKLLTNGGTGQGVAPSAYWDLKAGLTITEKIMDIAVIALALCATFALIELSPIVFVVMTALGCMSAATALVKAWF